MRFQLYTLSSWLKIRNFVGKTNWSKHWPCSWAFLGSPIDGCLAKGVVCRSVRNCLRRQRGCSDSASGFPEFGWCGWNSCHCCCDWHRHRHSQGQRSISCWVLAVQITKKKKIIINKIYYYYSQTSFLNAKFSIGKQRKAMHLKGLLYFKVIKVERS